VIRTDPWPRMEDRSSLPTTCLPCLESRRRPQVLSSATVTVGIRMTMPQWIEYGSACQAEKDEWNRFVAALQAHEQGHVDLAVEHLSNIDDRLVGKSVHGAGIAWQRSLDALRSASDAYDRQTDHGRTRGTIIDDWFGNARKFRKVLRRPGHICKQHISRYGRSRVVPGQPQLYWHSFPSRGALRPIPRLDRLRGYLQRRRYL
jgi:Bacterial protein of unknown function (DUF922)